MIALPLSAGWQNQQMRGERYDVPWHGQISYISPYTSRSEPLKYAA